MPSSTAVNAGYWYWNGELQPENIDSNLFTHLFAAFADVQTNTSTGTHDLIFPTDYEDKFQSFAETVKINNPDVRALLSIGGDTDPSVFTEIASKQTTRQAFIATCIEVATRFNYDGLSLHWQYPNTTDDRNNLDALLTEWRTAVKEEAPELLLTAAVYYSPQYYPTDAIKNSLDWINVMAYDLYTPTSDSSPNFTRPPAPLHSPTSSELITVDGDIRDWIDAGVPANLLVLGLPFFGRSWVLQNADEHEISSAANGASTDDPIPYSQILDFIQENNAVEVNNPSYVTHYCYAGTTWIGYDGKYSIFDKSRYAMEKGLLGYFAWHVGNDDTAGTLSNQASRAWNDI
ncbi:class V chitinase-like [Corylus avellana]|uniref:class V chitinase-like n=1 Tax=Corylus avellana TaxID=13451 RepID=UPI001E23A324|nr:class V chitinase-like [Corylus avellana]